MSNSFEKLTKLIKSSNSIIIMTHQQMDLDALGSALCLNKIIDILNKKSFIFLEDKLNNPIKKALEILSKNIKFINKETIVNKDLDLLIVLDTHKEKLLAYPQIIHKFKKIVIIDHHIINTDLIENTTLNIIESQLSSTNEILVNYLLYLELQVDSNIATVMLAGIETDTNSFNTKTTEKTYEAAAYLTRIGANNLEKSKLLKETKEEYLKIQQLIKKSFIVEDGIVLCLMDNKIYKNYNLAII
ncbi:MAG: DHH family phosphoesterase [Bacilli bacterium]